MFSVEPTLERTFFRSGAEALVEGRLSLGAEELGLADVGFLSEEGVPEGRGGVDVGLARLGATPATGAAPGTVVLFFTELVDVFLERLKSAAKVEVSEDTGSGERAKGSHIEAGVYFRIPRSRAWGVTWCRLCSCLLHVCRFSLGLDGCTDMHVLTMSAYKVTK